MSDTLSGLYPVVLLAHSWLRWIVLASGILVLGHGLLAWKASTPGPNPKLHKGFVTAINVQFLLGLLMYGGLSPIARVAFSDMGTAMGDSMLRFYFVEHVFGMTVAVSAAYVGFIRSRRVSTDPETSRRNLRATLWAQTVWLGVTLASVPWPGLPYGRPLFRLILPG